MSSTTQTSICQASTLVITLNRGCPPAPPISPNSFTVNTNATDKEFFDAFSASLSGPIHDYDIDESSAGVFNVTAKLSYLERFREQAKESKTVQERLACLEQIEQYTSEMLSGACLYNAIGQAAQNECWALLPWWIKHDMKASPYSHFPRLFGVWWMAWNHIFPDTYPLPLPLLLSGLPPLSAENEELAKMLIEDEEETAFGATVRCAWEETNAKGSELGELMLFCWAYKEGSKHARNTIAHPQPTAAAAKAQISIDLAPDTGYGHLSVFTIALVDRHSGRFRASDS